MKEKDKACAGRNSAKSWYNLSLEELEFSQKQSSFNSSWHPRFFPTLSQGWEGFTPTRPRPPTPFTPLGIYPFSLGTTAMRRGCAGLRATVVRGTWPQSSGATNRSIHT